MSWNQGPRVVAIGGGKGGVGKSLTAANVAMYLATFGKEVVLVDAAFGAATLHVFVGGARPSRTLGEYVRNPSRELLEQLATTTQVGGLRLISCAGDRSGTVMPPPTLAARLLSDLRHMNCDWIVVDLATGCAPFTLELFVRADIPVVLTIPDPAAVEQLYAFLRAAYCARFTALGMPLDAGSTDLPSPLQFYRDVARGPDDRPMREALLGLVPHLVVNAARSKADMELGRSIATAGHRRLGIPIDYLSNLEYDEAVWAATRRRRPVLIEFPESRVAKGLEKTARTLLTVKPPRLEGDVMPSEVHYDLLEVHPSASFEDIRRANRRIRDVYSPDSIAIAGLYTAAELEAVHRRLDTAYTTLMDALRRREYDLELFPDGPPQHVARLPISVHEDIPTSTATPPRHIRETRPPMPAIAPDTQFTGALLRQVREACGLTLRELSERSKIGMAYLEALEADAFERLPAEVYIRGFLGEYAKAFGLDGPQVKQSYLARMEEHDSEVVG